MKKNLTLLVLLFAVMWSNPLLSQDDKMVHFGISASPQMNVPKFERPDLSETKNSFGFKAQFDVYYDVNARTQLHSGVNINFLKISNIDYTPIFGCDIDDITGADINNSWIDNRNTITYLGIPVNARVKLVGKENHLYTKGGIELLTKINQKAESILVECGTNETVSESNIVDEASNFVLATNFGIGYEAKLTKKFKIFLEPTIGYTLTNVYKYRTPGTAGDYINNVKVLNYGLTIGIRN